MAALTDRLGAWGAGVTVACPGARVRASGQSRPGAAQLTLLTLVARGDQVALAAAGVVGAGQRSSTRSTAGELATTMTWHWTHLMFSKTGRGDGHLAGRTGQSFLLKGRFGRLLPGSSQLLLLRLHQDTVMAGSRAVVLTVRQGALTGQSTGGTGPRVAPVSL